MRIYPDTNAVHALHAALKAPEFDRRAIVAGIILAIGPNVIYELSRGFVSGRDTGKVRQAYGFLSEIQQVEYRPTLERYIVSEFQQAGLGVPIVTVLDRLNHAAVRLQLARLSRGDASEAAAFVSRREASIRTVVPQISQINRTRLKAFRKVKTFPEFRSRLWPTAVAQLMDLAAFHRVARTTEASMRRVLASAAEFPVLNAWLNAQWYCAWVAAYHATTTGNLDDLRHLLESARCDRIVTGDNWLRGVTPMISPSRPTWTWAQLRQALACPPEWHIARHKVIR